MIAARDQPFSHDSTCQINSNVLQQSRKNRFFSALEQV
jgi:hypothetical protein